MNKKIGMLFGGLLALAVAALIGPAKARNLGTTSPRVLLYANGTAGVGVGGQVQINLNSGTEVTYTFTGCNDGGDEILVEMDVVAGTELTTPTFEVAGSVITPSSVGRLFTNECVELGDYSSFTAVLQGETTAESFRIWGKR